MHASRLTPRARFVRHTMLAGALLAALAAGASAQAARVGHARMMSVSGQPLTVDLAVREVAAGQETLSVSAAPASAWRDAGLTPPVSLDSLAFQVEPGPVAGTQRIRVRSSQAFHGDIADLLLDIRSASGQLRHQVSVMAPDARTPGVLLAASGGQADVGGASTGAASAAGGAGAAAGAAGGSIKVKRGDTLFSIARSNAVPGVSVHQMMMALQAVNPDAFINGNVNRLKAGASLRLPNADELAVLSDAEARRLFHEQGEAFAAYRDRIAGMRGQAAGADAAQGSVAAATPSEGAAANAPAGDQLILSKAASDAKADDKRAADKNIADSRDRIAQLEENVQALNQAVGQGSGAPGEANQQGQASGGNAGSGEGGAGAANVTGGQPGGSGAGGAGGANDANGAQGAASTAAGAAGAASAANAAGGNDAGAAQNGIGVAAGQPGGGAAARTAADQANGQAAQGVDQSRSWWQDNMLGIVTGLLALLVLLLVWWLRRAGVNRGDAERGAPITEDMVRQKLEQIDLDLDDDISRRDGGKPL